MTIVRTALVASADKTAQAAWSALNATVSAGATLVVGIGYDPNSTITVSWGSLALTKAVSAVNGANAEGSIWHLLSSPLSTTSTVYVSWTANVTAKAAAAQQLTGVNTLDEVAIGTGTGTTICTASTTLTTGNPGEFAYGLFVTEGPAGDTAGTVGADTTTSGQRVGTTGGTAATNITINEGFLLSGAPATRSARLSGVTSRIWVAALATYANETVQVVSAAQFQTQADARHLTLRRDATMNVAVGFTLATTVTILGSTHGLGTKNLLIQAYDATGAALDPGRVTVDASTFDVVVTFAQPQSGMLVLNGFAAAAVTLTVTPAQWKTQPATAMMARILSITPARMVMQRTVPQIPRVVVPATWKYQAATTQLTRTISVAAAAWKTQPPLVQIPRTVLSSRVAWQAVPTIKTFSMAVSPSVMAWRAATKALTVLVRPSAWQWQASTPASSRLVAVTAARFAWQSPTALIARTLSTAPARWATQAATATLGRSLVVQRAVWQWQAITPIQGKLVQVSPGRFAWAAATSLSNRIIAVTPARVKWQALTGRSPLTANYARTVTVADGTTISIPGTTHQLGTPYLLIEVYSGTSTLTKIDVGRLTVHQSTYDVTVTLAQAMTGLIVLNAAHNTVSTQANYVQSFTGQTSVPITGATHGLNTQHLVVQVYDNGSPTATRIEPATVTVNPVSYDTTITFAQSQSGTILLNGYAQSGTTNYAQTFSNTTSTTVLGTAHTLNTSSILVQVYDNGSPTATVIQPASVSINASTRDVTVTFAQAQSGTVVLNGTQAGLVVAIPAQWKMQALTGRSPLVANYARFFSNATSVSIPGTSHNLGTKNLLVQVYDNGTPTLAAIEPDSVTVHTSTYDVTVTFAVAQTGWIMLNAYIPSTAGQTNVITPFTAVQSVSIPGATHGLGTKNLIPRIYNNSGPMEVQPGSVTVNPVTYDVAVAFATTQTGFVLLNGYASSGVTPNYATTFSSVTTFTVAGSTHGLGTKNILVQVYDAGSPTMARMQPNSIAVDGNSFDVTITFNIAQSGLIVLNGSGQLASAVASPARTIWDPPTTRIPRTFRVTSSAWAWRAATATLGRTIIVRPIPTTAWLAPLPQIPRVVLATAWQWQSAPAQPQSRLDVLQAAMAWQGATGLTSRSLLSVASRMTLLASTPLLTRALMSPAALMALRAATKALTVLVRPTQQALMAVLPLVTTDAILRTVAPSQLRMQAVTGALSRILVTQTSRVALSVAVSSLATRVMLLPASLRFQASMAAQSRSVTSIAASLRMQAATVALGRIVTSSPARFQWTAATKALTVLARPGRWAFLAATALLTTESIMRTVTPSRMVMTAATSLLGRTGIPFATVLRMSPPVSALLSRQVQVAAVLRFQAPTPMQTRALVSLATQTRVFPATSVLTRALAVTSSLVAWRAVTKALTVLVRPGRMTWQAVQAVSGKLVLVSAGQVKFQAATKALTVLARPAQSMAQPATARLTRTASSLASRLMLQAPSSLATMTLPSRATTVRFQAAPANLTRLANSVPASLCWQAATSTLQVGRLVTVASRLAWMTGTPLQSSRLTSVATRLPFQTTTPALIRVVTASPARLMWRAATKALTLLSRPGLVGFQAALPLLTAQSVLRTAVPAAVRLLSTAVLVRSFASTPTALAWQSPRVNALTMTLVTRSSAVAWQRGSATATPGVLTMSPARLRSVAAVVGIQSRLLLSPAAWQWRATAPLGGRVLQSTPAQMRAQTATSLPGRIGTVVPPGMGLVTRATVLGRTATVSTAMLAYRVQSILGRTLRVTPGKVGWQAQTPFTGIVFVQPTAMAWQAPAAEAGLRPTVYRRLAAVGRTILTHHAPVQGTIIRRHPPVLVET